MAETSGLCFPQQERMSTVISMVEKKLGSYGVKISHPNGGYFLWLEMPSHVTAAEVSKVAAEKENVTFVNGNGWVWRVCFEIAL